MENEPVISKVFILETLLVLLVLAVVGYVLAIRKKEKKARVELEENYRIRLLSATLEAQEAERKKIAGEIHDNLASILSAIRIHLQYLARDAKLNGNFLQSLEEADKMLEEGLDMSRRLIQNLSPKTLEAAGLTEAIRELCSRISNSNMFKIRFSAYEVPVSIEMTRSLFIYRVVQELLSNCVKHSGATSISLEVYWGPILCITMLDNGKPFEYNFKNHVSNEGLGILNLRNRLDLLKAKIQTESGAVNKTQLFVPVDPDAVGAQEYSGTKN